MSAIKRVKGEGRTIIYVHTHNLPRLLRTLIRRAHEKTWTERHFQSSRRLFFLLLCWHQTTSIHYQCNFSSPPNFFTTLCYFSLAASRPLALSLRTQLKVPSGNVVAKAFQLSNNFPPFLLLWPIPCHLVPLNSTTSLKKQKLPNKSWPFTTLAKVDLHQKIQAGLPTVSMHSTNHFEILLCFDCTMFQKLSKCEVNVHNIRLYLPLNFAWNEFWVN